MNIKDLIDNSFSGFTLSGYLKPNGMYKTIFNNLEFKEFPEEITIHGNTFTLELIETYSTDKDGNIFICAQYA